MNAANPKLSIIIPCYNCVKTLQQAVESCFVQGFDTNNFEIVMVDDGSADDTKELMQQLAAEHNNIRLSFNPKNLGGGATRNVAVSLSKGGVIFGLDSDDMLPPGTLLKMYNFLQEKGCDGVSIHRSVKFSTHKNVHENDAEDGEQKIEHIDTSHFAGEKIPFTSLFSRDNAFRPLYVTFMYTRNAFNRSGGFPENHGYDTQGFGWRFLCAGLTAYTCPDAEYLHRIHAGESYYLREFNNGKMNYNWRDILLEHHAVFTQKAQEFICTFDCKDFTRNIMDELISMNDVLRPNIEKLLPELKKEKLSPSTVCPGISLERIYISRRSPRGYYLRIKQRMKNITKNIIKKLPLSDSAKKFLRRTVSPAWIYFLKKSTYPLSTCYGFERGTPLDRFYIENFLEKNKADIKGTCLELLSNDYTKKYGGQNISKSDVLDIDATNQNATVIDDLRKLSKVADNTYDSIILTQVLQFIDDVDAAISECHRVLKTGGVLLATLPSLSRIDRMSGEYGDFWRFTTASAKYLFHKKFTPENISVESTGNVRSGIYFYAGLCIEETEMRTLEQNDANFPLIITVRAVK